MSSFTETVLSVEMNWHKGSDIWQVSGNWFSWAIGALGHGSAQAEGYITDAAANSPVEAGAAQPMIFAISALVMVRVERAWMAPHWHSIPLPRSGLTRPITSPGMAGKVPIGIVRLSRITPPPENMFTKANSWRNTWHQTAQFCWLLTLLASTLLF